MNFKTIACFLSLQLALSPAFAAIRSAQPLRDARGATHVEAQDLALPVHSEIAIEVPARLELDGESEGGVQAVSERLARIAETVEAEKEALHGSEASPETSSQTMGGVVARMQGEGPSSARGTLLSVAAVPLLGLISAKGLAIAAGGAALLGTIHYGARMVRNTLALKPAQAAGAAVQVDPGMVDVQKAAERLGKALSFKTISYQDPAQFPVAEFEKLRAHLKESFPLVFAKLQPEHVNTHSLLFTWKGTDESLKPVLMLGHQDVVPVEPGTEKDWKEEPFSGKLDGEFVWGRGAIDDKGGMMANLEAVEALLKAGHQPKRTIYLAFGHDEEVGGREGALLISKLLQSRGVQLEAVYDEGGRVAMNQYPGVDRPVAQVSIAEKGYLTLRLDAKGQGAHSSLPPPAEQRSILTLSKAIKHLHDHEHEDFPLELTSVVLKTMTYLAPYMPTFWLRLVYANLWFPPFKNYVMSKWVAIPSGHAVLRTTTAPTMIGGGVKENVMPQSVWAIVNHRLLAGDTVAAVIERIKKRIGSPNLTVTALERTISDPTAESDMGSPAYKALEKTIREVLPEAIIVPSLLTGATDSRHFRILTGSRHMKNITENIYRFRPWRAMTAEDLRRFHGTNERVSIKNYGEYVSFYIQLIRNLEGLDSPGAGPV